MSWPRIDLGGTFVHGLDRGLTALAHTATDLWSTSPLLVLAAAVAVLVAVSMARPNRV